MTTCRNCQTNLASSGNKRQKIYCSTACQSEFQYRTYITEWHSGQQSGAKYEGEVSNHVRRWLHERAKSRCEECDWAKVNKFTGKVPLTVNHIDGDSNNHRPENLELICWACHSLTESFGSRNRGRGRQKRIGAMPKEKRASI